MKAVDVLIDARDLLSDQNNWGTTRLCSDGKFCANGAIDLTSGCLKLDGSRTGATVDGLYLEACGGVALWTSNPDNHIVPIGTLSHQERVEYASVGAFPMALEKAYSYLTAASRKLYGKAVYQVNDRPLEGFGYPAIMKVFDLAIKNAKRRHINGDRQKPKATAKAA